MSKGKLQLDQAKALAAKIVAELAPVCDRIEVAGSIRRGEQVVGDIEILCQPRPAPGTPGLLPGLSTLDDSGWSIDPIIERLIDQGRLERHNNGVLHRKFLATISGALIDLFVVADPSTWGVQLAIRTGPANLSQRMVTVQSKGGLLPEYCEIRDGWRLYRDGARVETPEEIDFLRALDAEHLADQARRRLERTA